MMHLMKTLRAAVFVLSLSALACPAWAQSEDGSAAPEETATEAPTEARDAAGLGFELPEPASQADMSYAIGVRIGSSIKRDAEVMDTEQLLEGIRAGLGELESRLSDEQIDQAMYSFQVQMRERMLRQARENLAKGQAYLQANAEKEGVVTTESGLQYKVITEGDGATPTVNDIVLANYRGTLIDGTEFDRSEEGEPAVFPVADVIPGWTEALQLMQIGDKWELAIPAELGYREFGSQNGEIGPNEVLLFEIELVEIR